MKELRIQILLENGQCVVKSDDLHIGDHAGDIVGNLNAYIQGGWRVESIENEVYTLVTDANIVYLVEYSDLSKGVYYSAVLPYCEACFFEMHRQCDFEEISVVSLGGIEKEVNLSFVDSNLTIQSLVNAKEDYIEMLGDRSDLNTCDLLEIIEGM